MLHDVWRVLNSQVWPLFNEEESDEVIEELFSMSSAIEPIFNRYGALEVFKEFTSDNVIEGFIDILSLKRFLPGTTAILQPNLLKGFSLVPMVPSKFNCFFFLEGNSLLVRTEQI